MEVALGAGVGRGAEVTCGAGLGVALAVGFGTAVGLGAGGSALATVGLGRGFCGAGSGTAADVFAAGLAGPGSLIVAGTGAPRSGAISAAASARRSGEVDFNPTDSVKVTVIRSGGGITGSDGGRKASQAISRACRPAATASPMRSSLAGREETMMPAVKALPLRVSWSQSHRRRELPAKLS